MVCFTVSQFATRSLHLNARWRLLFCHRLRLLTLQNCDDMFIGTSPYKAAGNMMCRHHDNHAFHHMMPHGEQRCVNAAGFWATNSSFLWNMWKNWTFSAVHFLTDCYKRARAALAKLTLLDFHHLITVYVSVANPLLFFRSKNLRGAERQLATWSPYRLTPCKRLVPCAVLLRRSSLPKNGSLSSCSARLGRSLVDFKSVFLACHCVNVQLPILVSYNHRSSFFKR